MLTCLLLGACAQESAHVPQELLDREASICRARYAEEKKAGHPQPMTASMQCMTQRVMPLFITSRPEREPQIRALFDDMEIMGAMADRGAIPLKRVQEYWNDRALEALYGDKPECADHPEANNCIIRSPFGGQIMERSYRPVRN